MEKKPEQIPGLSVKLDKLVYHTDDNLPDDTPHAFVYFLTITNLSDRTVTLRGRKWVIQHTDGNTLVVEGDGIVGKTPTLKPNESFSYNSYHVASCNSRAFGSFHGVDEHDRPIFVKIPAFEMKIPDETNES